MPDYKFPADPPADVLDWFRAKRIKPSFDYRDVWQKEHAQAFTVAKAMRSDVLTSIREALDDAIANGKTLDQFRKELTPTLQRLGWWGRQEMSDPLTRERREVQLGSPRRLRTIYNTNMRTARAAGQWQRIERRKRTHTHLVYELGPSERHRLQHLQWAGLVLPVDDPWWQTHYPPNGWGCKCRVRQITRREADRLVATGKYGTEPPPILRKEWVNDRTGEVQRVPVGIDPGFDYNPGMSRGKATVAAEKTARKEMKKAIAKPVVDPVLPAESVYSTARGVTQKGIEDALAQIEGSAPQMQKVREFMQAHPIKLLAIKEREMGTGKTAAKLSQDIGRFLGIGNAWGKYNTQRARRVGGFTFLTAEHIVVKVKPTDNLARVDMAAIGSAVEKAVEMTQKGDRQWAITHVIERTAAAAESGLISTWLHELGHQVHFWAGTPKPWHIKDKTSLTEYGDYNNHEWHAEHFTAWALNRDALAKWNPEIAEWMDKVVDDAIRNTTKGKRNP